VCGSNDANFAGRLIRRLGTNSHLIDAAAGKLFLVRKFPVCRRLRGGVLSAGLQVGDRVLISCGLSPQVLWRIWGHVCGAGTRARDERRSQPPGIDPGESARESHMDL